MNPNLTGINLTLQISINLISSKSIWILNVSRIKLRSRPRSDLDMDMPIVELILAQNICISLLKQLHENVDYLITPFWGLPQLHPFKSSCECTPLPLPQDVGSHILLKF
jgi:hypothetical protein